MDNKAKLIDAINESFGKIYDMGDSGLNYMEEHSEFKDEFLNHISNATLNTLTEEQLTLMSNSLETIADDASFDVEDDEDEDDEDEDDEDEDDEDEDDEDE